MNVQRIEGGAMSEQMFGIKVNGGIVDAAPSADEATDKAIIF